MQRRKVERREILCEMCGEYFAHYQNINPNCKKRFCDYCIHKRNIDNARRRKNERANITVGVSKASQCSSRYM